MGDELDRLAREAQLAQAQPSPVAGSAGAGGGGGEAPAAVAAGAGGGGGGGEAPRTESPEEWRDGLKFVAGIVCEAYPQLAPIYTDERLGELGTRLHAVAVKHGWSMGAWFLRWKEEIALAMIAGPMLRDTAKALRPAKPAAARSAAGGEAAAPPPPASPPAPDALRPTQGDDLSP